MDLMRRQAAGELAEIIGPAVVKVDRRHRVHRFRERARQVLAASSPADRALFAAYADGVNAGLSSLGGKPFEYLAAARRSRRPGGRRTRILAVYAMFFELNDDTGRRESALGVLRDTLPAPMFDFLRRARHRVGRARSWVRPSRRRRSPGRRSSICASVRRSPKAAPRCGRQPAGDEELAAAAAGSNNWAVAGPHTADGHALLANDMHLGIRRAEHLVPRLAGPAGRRRAGRCAMTGVTLPGTPTFVVGSNGHVAWGFTNSYGDWTDLVELEVDPKDPDVYRTPRRAAPLHDGPGAHPGQGEARRRAGGQGDDLGAGDRQGPARPSARARLDRPSPGGGEPASSTSSRRRAPWRRRWRSPTAPASRRRTSRSPTRRGGSAGRSSAGSRAASASTGAPRPPGPTARVAGTAGWRRRSTRASSIRPPGGSGRPTPGWCDGEMLAKVGNGGYDLGARARQIRDDLMKLERATPARPARRSSSTTAPCSWSAGATCC